MARLLIRLAALGVGLWLAGLLGVVAVHYVLPRSTALPAPADAIICLGADMSRKGWERPGPASKRRALTCAELYAAGVAPIVAFTGYGHHIRSAAEAMAEVAVAQGVPQEAVVVEVEAQSTIQNAAFTQALLPTGTARVVIVSDAFHLPRSRVIFSFVTDWEVAAYATPRGVVPREGNHTPGEAAWVMRESLAIWSNMGRWAYYGLRRARGDAPDEIIASFN